MQTARPSCDVRREVVELGDRGEAFAVAVVLQAKGSTPCKAGASAVVDTAGAIRGTIGGGLIEAEAQRRAVEAIRTRQPDVFDFRLEGDTVASGTPICGGTVRVLIDPTGAQHRKEYVRAAATQETRARGALLTTIRGEGPWEVAVRFVQAEELDRVYAPIGLDIGAVTVPEIAASIVAQLIAVRLIVGYAFDSGENSSSSAARGREAPGTQ